MSAGSLFQFLNNRLSSMLTDSLPTLPTLRRPGRLSPIRSRFRSSSRSQALSVTLAALLGAVAAALPTAAAAHDAWIDLGPDGPAIQFGHVGEPETVDAAKIRQIRAVDAAGQSLSVVQVPAERAVGLTIDGKPALLALSYDNGYWSRPPGASASINKPRNEVPGAEGGARVLKYGKTIVQWSAVVTRPVGQTLEIVPLVEREPAAGEQIAVRVLWQGQPLAGARVLSTGGSRDDAGAGSGGGAAAAEVRPAVAQADASGRAVLPLSRGTQFLSVSHREPLVDDVRADTVSVSANLLFRAR